jgi:hypothetical protein
MIQASTDLNSFGAFLLLTKNVWVSKTRQINSKASSAGSVGMNKK